jgi:hypothetical protein
MKTRSVVLAIIGVVGIQFIAHAQTAAPAPAANATSGADNASFIFRATIANIQGNAANGGQASGLVAVRDLIPFIQLGATDDKYRVDLLSQLEQKRIDQQVGPGSTQNGTTNAVTKGSVPWLIGVAQEYGATTQSTSGNTTTFKLNPINLIAALNTKNYVDSYTAGDSAPMVSLLRKVSFGFSFNTSSQPSGVSSSSSTGLTNSNAFTGFTAHYDIYNKRDPRDPKWDDLWVKVFKDQAIAAGASISQVEKVLCANPSPTNPCVQWKVDTIKAVESAKNSTPDQIRAVLQTRAEALKKIIAANQEAQKAVDQAAQALLNFSSARSTLISNIMKSTIVSADYNLIKQSNQPLVNARGNAIVTTPGPIPDLSNFNLIVETNVFRSAGSVAQFTANMSTTLFNSTPPGSHAGRVRDYRLSGQVDIPSGTIPGVGDATTTFSGVFLSLLEQPLGQTVKVNTVDVNTKGNMGLFQAKISVKVKNTGVQIPISFTYATRTELVKESNVGGNVGVTFNFDSLFAGPKANK